MCGSQQKPPEAEAQTPEGPGPSCQLLKPLRGLQHAWLAGLMLKRNEAGAWGH